MSNYPPGTWEGDPRAPWNEPDPWEGRTCGECRFGSYSSDRSIFVCTFQVLEHGSGEVELIEPEAAACEAFEEV